MLGIGHIWPSVAGAVVAVYGVVEFELDATLVMLVMAVVVDEFTVAPSEECVAVACGSVECRHRLPLSEGVLFPHRI